jgi:RNA recognition motif-containing protein
LLASGVLNKLTENDFKKYFSKYGAVLKVQKERSRSTNQKVRFAYIQFASSSSVEQAIKQAIHEINHHIVDVRKTHEDDIHWQKF